MKKNFFNWYVFILIIAIFKNFIAVNVFAEANNKQLKGFVVTPSFQEIILKEEEREKNFKVKVTNNTSFDQKITYTILDLPGFDEYGTFTFQKNPFKPLSNKYQITPFIELEKEEILLEKQSTREINFSIQNKQELMYGGHYGAIVIEFLKLSEKPTSSSRANVYFKQKIASLIFVKKAGGEVYDLELEKDKKLNIYFSLPEKLELSFKNKGNTHTVPRGLVEIFNPRGEKIAQGVINSQSSFIFPETIKKISVPLKYQQNKKWLLPGKYEVIINYRYREKEEFKNLNFNFYYFNPFFLVPIFFLVFVIILLRLVAKRRRLCD